MSLPGRTDCKLHTMALDDTLFQSCLKNPNLPFLRSSQSETILLLVFAATANPWLRQWEVLGEVTGLQQSPTPRHDLEHIPHGLGLPIFATQRLIKEFQGSSHCRQYIIPMCWLQANKNVSCKPFWDKPSQIGAYIPLVTQPAFPSRGSIWLEVPGVRHPD